jgi:hypothetical protein
VKCLTEGCCHLTVLFVQTSNSSTTASNAESPNLTITASKAESVSPSESTYLGNAANDVVSDSSNKALQERQSTTPSWALREMMLFLT